MKFFSLVFVLFTVYTTDQSIFCYAKKQDSPFNPPAPLSLYNGFVLNDCKKELSGLSKIEIEVFLDLICPDSTRAWETLKEVSKNYCAEDVAIRIRQYPLPYHRNAYLASKGYFAINDYAADNSTKYIDAVFKNQNKLTDSATTSNDDEKVLSLLASIASTATGISEKEFSSKIGDYKSEARYDWKYGARKGVAGTPWYFLNGVDLVADPSRTVTVENWIHLIENLLNPTRKRSEDSYLNSLMFQIMDTQN